MVPDNERAWRESIRAVRLTLAHLENPAPALFADFTTSEETLADLSQPLPLVDFTPFQMPPDDTGEVRSEPQLQPARGVRRPPIIDIERENAKPEGSLYGLFGTLHGPREAPLIPDLGTRAFDFLTPALSFPPAEAPGHSAVRPPRTLEQGTDAVAHRVGESTVSSPDRDIRREHERASRTSAAREDASNEDGSHELSLASGPAWPGLGPGPNRLENPGVALADADQQASLLSLLAEDALKTVGRRRPGDLVRRASVSSEPADFVGQAIYPGGVGAGSGGDMASLDTLAERLLASEVQVGGRLPNMPESDDGAVQSPAADGATARTSPGHVPFILRNDIEEQNLGRPPVTGWVDGEIPDMSSGRGANAQPNMDADDYATLVNEALVRQARRHGVDLS